MCEGLLQCAVQLLLGGDLDSQRPTETGVLGKVRIVERRLPNLPVPGALLLGDLAELVVVEQYMGDLHAVLDGGSQLAHVCRDLELNKADGMVFGFYDFDRYLGGHQRLLARMVEERTGLPIFYLEGNSWEDRDYSPEALRTKIESICEILKMKKG